MRILQIPGYFFPEKVASIYLEDNRQEAFSKAEFYTVVYTSRPQRGLSGEEYQEYKQKKVEMMYDNHVEVHRFAMYREGKNPILRALRYFLISAIQFWKGVWTKDIDLIYVASTPPTQGALAVLIKKIKRVPFVYNLQDIFPDSLVGSGLAKKGGLLWRIGRMIEDFTYRNSDKIIVISEDFKRNIMAKGVPEDKIVVVYNWVDEKAIHPVPKGENPLFEEFGLSREKFTVVYAGNLGNAQNISIILDGAKELSDVQFVIFGTGGLEGEVRRRITKEGISNVYLFPLQPYNRVSAVYSLGDACVVSCKEGFGGSAMPSKTWTIMSCGRPVIASFDEGELKEILEKNECGLFTRAGEVKEFTEGVKSLANNLARCSEMGRNARRFILEHLTKEVGTQKYVEVIRSFAPKG